MTYYSQIGQDQYFVENVVNGKRNGVFLDIGANDGIFTSNTATLEFEYGWTGICIEANPNLINELKSNRPNSVIVNKAVWNNNTEVQFEIPQVFKDEIPGNVLGRITGIEELDARNYKYFKRQFDAGTDLVTVEADTVTNILSQIMEFPTVIDYMSLDTEGAEMEALESIDFTQIDIRFMTVEHGNRDGSINNFQLYLQQYGYRVHRINEWDVEFER